MMNQVRSAIRAQLFSVCLLGLSLFLAGCREVTLNPARTASKSDVEVNRWDFCNNLDRHGISSMGGNLPPATGGAVIAGYSTTWEPGAPPFPCHRFIQHSIQGLFDFNVASLRAEPTPEPFRSAILELVEFRPGLDGIRVTETPSGGFGEGVLSGTRRTCTFKVMANAQAWGTSRTGPLISTTELASRPRNILVSDDGASRWTADVSREVGAWYRGERPEVGFSVVHNDPAGFGAHQSNKCVGYFRFRLRTFIGANSR